MLNLTISSIYDTLLIVTCKKRCNNSLFLCKESDDMSDSYLSCLQSSFQELKEIIESNQYRIINVIPKDKFVNTNYYDIQEMNQYIEGQLYHNIMIHMVESKVIDIHTNQIVEDSYLSNKVLWAHMWYSLNQNYSLKTDKCLKKADDIFNFDSFMNYINIIKLMLVMDKLSYNIGQVYNLLDGFKNDLLYFVKEIIQSTFIHSNSSDCFLDKTQNIYHPSSIFLDYMGDLSRNYHYSKNVLVKK